MKMCVICGDRRPDSNGDHINEDFCEKCLETDTQLLRKIQLNRKQEEEGPLEPGKDTKEAR
jgi:reverse gyrase